MAGTNGSMPYIKHEDDQANNPHQYMLSPNQYAAAQFGQSFGSNLHNQVVDPSDLSMQNVPYAQQNFGNFGAQQNLSSSFTTGRSAFEDDELFESLNEPGQQVPSSNVSTQQRQYNQYQSTHQPHPTGISMSHQGQMTHVYSNTPDGLPIQSPFLNGGFDFSQFGPNTQHISPQQMYAQGITKRPSLHGPNRKSSDQRNPMTPRSSAMASLQLSTPESGSFPSQPIRATSLQNRHQKTLSSNHNGSTPESLDSPLTSPFSHHNGISEVLKSGQHASLPPKMGHGQGTNGSNNQDDKKKRRRDSHNQVERRRRDNINDRIQDLSHLVPLHRLDDDKVKKQLQNSSPNAGATSMSPPNAATAATSLLAGASGRRAASTAGNITLGLPIEEKEKGPNKGDILTGAVGWTRDLMWALHQKYMQDDELAQHITQLGGCWPFEITEDERRMRSEVMAAMEKNDVGSFGYTRAHGSGLHVPRYTNIAGDPVQGADQISPGSMLELSPGFHSGGSGTNSGSGGPGQAQYWNSAGHPGMSFKEEDEYGDDMMSG